MFSKIKNALKKTFIYSIYIFLRKLLKIPKRIYKKIKATRNKIKNKWNKYYTLRILFPRIYNKYAKLPVDENKVIFVEVRMPAITNSYKVLYDELTNKYNYDVHCHFLRNVSSSRKVYNQRCCELMKDLATAKYVFNMDGSNALGCVNMRPETVYTQLWHGCGAFKKFGFSCAELIFGETKEQMLKYPNYKNITNVTVSSPEVIWAFEEAMGQKPGVVKATGVSRTDVFYDEKFIEQSFKKLHEVMPESVGKKVILYAPTFRGRVAKAQTSNMLNIKLFMENLSDDYVLLFKHHFLVKKIPNISIKYESFAKDVTESMSIEELLCVSDICISDYSSLVFEYSIFEKPLIFFPYDLDEYFDWRGFYYDYFELAPGPIFTTNLEMIDYIQNVDTRFDKERVHAFREKFMSSCDGHATERIMNLVFGDSLEAHKKPENEVTDYPLNTIPRCNPSLSERERTIEKVKGFRDSTRKVYEEASKQPIVKNKVVVLLKGAFSDAKIFGELLIEDGNFDVEMLPEKDIMSVESLATARFIVVEGPSMLMKVLNIREGTDIIELTDNTLPFKKAGYAAIKTKAGFNNDLLKIVPLHGKYTMVTVASDFAKEAYKEIYNISDDSKFKKIGTVKSDILFDKKFIKETRERIFKVFPSAKDKKIIYYMPTERIDKVNRPAAAAFLNVGMMYEYLKKDHVLLYKYSDLKQNKLSVSKNYSSFACNMNKLPVDAETGEKPSFSVIELMAAADILISDYKSKAFDFIATEKPIFFYTPDLAVQDDLGDTFVDYREITDGFRYTDTTLLAKQIRNIESYDFDRLHNLKKQYFEFCDGKAGKNLIQIMKDMI